MVQIWSRIPFERFELAFDYRMLPITFEWFEFGFESLLSGSNLDSNASNPFRMVQNFIRLLRIPFKGFEFGFECFESVSNGSNLESNVSNPFRVVRYLDLNASNPFQMVRICIRML